MIHALRNNRPFPCFKATGEWTHDGLTYRGIVDIFQRWGERSLGSTVVVVFAPNPATVAGKGEPWFRVVPPGETEPPSERPVFLGLLALAGLLWIPAISMLFKLFAGA